jgi:hypothetical protein
MTELTRYDVDMDGSMEPCEDGRWVRYDDLDRTKTEQIADVEYYRALLLLAGIEYTSEHKLENGYTPGRGGVQPWLLAMTAWGPLTIGWRKRVIDIDWQTSKYPAILIEPPEEYITHAPGFIHCYGYEQAIRALKALKLQFERHVYYDSLGEPKKSEEIARLKKSEADERPKGSITVTREELYGQPSMRLLNATEGIHTPAAACEYLCSECQELGDYCMRVPNPLNT